VRQKLYWYTILS